MTQQRQSAHQYNAFCHCLKASFVVLFIMIGLFFYYVWSEKQIDAANEQRYQTRLIADELRQSSDELTGMVRSYVITGDRVYLQNLQTFLAIRDGKLPRPEQYDLSYWYRAAAGSMPNSTNIYLPFSTLLEQAGFSADEQQKLAAAKLKSDQLTATEFKAISLIKSATADDDNTRKQAQMLVFDPTYQQQKREIMQLIDEVTQLSQQRTVTAVKNATEWAALMRMLFIGFGLLLSLLIWLSEKQFRKMLGTNLPAVYKAIEQLGDGQFSSQLLPKAFAENSILGHLAHAQAKLQNLLAEQEKSRKSLLLMSKVFSEAQEGMFLTDLEGTVLDVNLAFLMMTGYSRKESVGHTSLVFRPDRQDNDFFAELWRQVKEEGRWRGEIWCKKKDGAAIACILNFSMVNDSDGHLLCYMGMMTDITQLKTHQQEIEQIAYHDPLTRLPNRPLLADRMQQGLARVGRSGNMLAIACLDLDGFKAVNDTYGHGMGDALLLEVANRLQSCVRNCDTVARLGGDEFSILLCEIDSREQCEITLQRILRALVAPYNLFSQQINQISGSIGYTLFPYDNVDPDTLLRHADHAMYLAKQAGKNRFEYFDVREDKRVQANWSVIARIDKALKNDEFRLFIQPKINLKTGHVVGAEALIRWQHPIRGLVAPAEFLPLIEDHDIAIKMGEWVINKAMTILKTWREQQLVQPLSINIGARHLRQEKFSMRLASILQQFPTVPANQLEIEIVESAALDDLQKVSELISECKKLGVHFALDDFGTGYSALTYLKRLSVSTLKIDQTFVRDLLTDENDLAIVRGIIGLAKAFDTQIVAEGVETWQQADCLLELGCEIAQGYAIAHPMPADEFLSWANQFKMPELSGA